MHLRKCIFYTPETEKALCWALCAIVANRNTYIRFLTTPPPTRRVCDTFAFLNACCFLRLTMDHWHVAALEKRRILVANKVKRNWPSV